MAALLAVQQEGPAAQELDYDKLVFLDAESLAEGGIKEAYETLRPLLSGYVETPAPIEEFLDHEVPRYSVRFAGRDFVIYSPELDDAEGQSWGRATYAFFTIVNSQLASSSHRFFAINGGNDLAGMFLTPQQVEAARATLPRKSDWPYRPTLEHPRYGQNR
jgi:hypothetical protein